MQLGMETDWKSGHEELLNQVTFEKLPLTVSFLQSLHQSLVTIFRFRRFPKAGNNRRENMAEEAKTMGKKGTGKFICKWCHCLPSKQVVGRRLHMWVLQAAVKRPGYQL